jgi:hypothetical protein
MLISSLSYLPILNYCLPFVFYLFPVFMLSCHPPYFLHSFFQLLFMFLLICILVCSFLSTVVAEAALISRVLSYSTFLFTNSALFTEISFHPVLQCMAYSYNGGILPMPCFSRTEILYSQLYPADSVLSNFISNSTGSCKQLVPPFRLLFVLIYNKIVYIVITDKNASCFENDLLDRIRT